MNKFIPYGKQHLNKSDFNALKKAFYSNFITGGNSVSTFEKKFCEYTKAKYSVSCSSGTAAIHLALEAIGLKKNDNVIIPAINFVAAANLVKKIGAKVFLADVDPISGQMRPSDLLKCIKQNKIKKIKAFFSMYNGGNPNHVIEFYKIKKKHKCFFIEDSCHALGAIYSYNKNLKVGDCKFSDISTFSFHPVKSITTGEGGMITTSKYKIYKKCQTLKNHGILRKKSNKKKYYWKYQIIDHGFNYRLSDLNCSIGISQLKKLDFFIKKRNKIAKLYNKLLSEYHDIIYLPKVSKDQKSAWHLYIVNINFKKLKISREKLIQKLFLKKIITQVHYIPTFAQPAFSELKNKNLFNSIRYFENSISLPIYVDLKPKIQRYVADCLIKIIKLNRK